MRKPFTSLILFLSLASCDPNSDTVSRTSAVTSGPVEFIIIAGQSNAQGYGNYTQTAPVPSWAQNTANGWDGSPVASSDTLIQYPHPTLALLPACYNSNNTGLLSAQYDACGTFVSAAPKPPSGAISSESGFGPELSFVYKYHADHPNSELMVLKQAVGGSSIDEWVPSATNKYFPLLQKQILDAKARVTAAGKTCHFAAFVWVHGESGAASIWPYLNPTPGQEYVDKARTIFSAVRAMTSSTMPVVVARIGNHLLADVIIDPMVIPNSTSTAANLRGATNYRRNQQVLLGSDPYSAWVSTDDLPVLQQGNSAYWYHHTSRGYLAEGERLYAGLLTITPPVQADAGQDVGPDASLPDLGPEAPPPLAYVVKFNGVVQPGKTFTVKLNGNLVTLPGGAGDTLEVNVQ